MIEVKALVRFETHGVEIAEAVELALTDLTRVGVEVVGLAARKVEDKEKL